MVALSNDRWKASRKQANRFPTNNIPLSRSWILTLMMVVALPSLIPSSWNPFVDAWLMPGGKPLSTTLSRRLQQRQLQIQPSHGLSMLDPRLDSDGHETSLKSSASSSSSVTESMKSSSSCRRILKIEKFARLPVWPVEKKIARQPFVSGRA